MIKALLKRILPLTTLLAGLGYSFSCAVPAYGMPGPEGDPDVKITDFSYTPGPTVERGDNMTFSVTLNKAPLDIFSQRVSVYVGEIQAGSWRPSKWDGHTAILDARDDGIAPDLVANDFVYTAGWKVPADYPLDWDIPVEAGYYDEDKGGPYFTVEEND